MATDVQVAAKPSKTGTIVGAVVGSVGGLLVIVLAVLVTRYCLIRRRTKASSDFGADESLDLAEVTPYVEKEDQLPVTLVSGASESADQLDLRGTDKRSSKLLFDNNRRPSTEDPMSMLADEGSDGVPDVRPSSPLVADLVMQEKEAAAAAAAAAAARSRAAESSAPAGPTSRRAIHEQDAEDATVDILPPVYREAWAARHSHGDLSDEDEAFEDAVGEPVAEGPSYPRREDEHAVAFPEKLQSLNESRS